MTDDTKVVKAISAAGGSAGGAARMIEPGRPAARRVEVPIKKATGPGDDKVHTWPHLVRVEFLVAIFVVVLLIVWSLLVDAALEEPANPTRRPNPS